MTLPGRSALLALVVLAGCSDGNNNHYDAASTIDGPCGANVFFTGEFVDWDSTEMNFCGVFMAKFQVHGGGAMFSTNPNGRFELCLTPAATTQVDVTPPASSVCSAGGTYAIPGLVIANKAEIATGKLFSARALKAERVAPFYSQFLLTYDAAKAGVFVHVEGTPRAVSLAVAHDPPLVYDGTTWSAGDIGANVFFPNVMIPTNPTAAVVSAGGAIGEGPVPVVANTFTYLTLVAN